jgi:hypothetical protein
VGESTPGGGERMKNIIKMSGKMPAIIAALKTLKATHGDGVTVANIAIKTRYNILENALQNQLGKDAKKCLY